MSGPLLAVASTGGHLNELRQLVPRLDPPPQRVEWVTFDTKQSRSQLAGERVHFVRPTVTRDARAIIANVRPALRILRAVRPSAVVSTGAGVALSFLPLARAMGIPAHYVESATRLSGPSSTGRLLAAVPGVRTYTQDRRWESRSWLYRGSVFDAYEAAPPRPAPDVLRRIVVVLGTNPYGFRRLLDRLVEILPPGVEGVWQTGVTDPDGLPIDAHRTLPAHELHGAMERADVVVAHAGIGAALAALEHGRIPVLVPRRQDRGEQIDDHQLVVAAELADRGLAVCAEPDTLDLAVLTEAARLRATIRPEPPRFVLSAPPGRTRTRGR